MSGHRPLPLRADFVAFVNVEEVEEGLDIVAVGDAEFFFAFREALAGVVAPAAFAEIRVPDLDIFGRRFAAVGEAPFEHVGILAAEVDADGDIFVFHAEEGAAAGIESAAESFVVIRGQFTLGVEANFIEHAAKVNDVAKFFMRTAKAGDFHGGIVAFSMAGRNREK